MASHPTSEAAGEADVEPQQPIRLLTSAGLPVHEPPEWEPLLIEALVPLSRWQDASLDRQGVHLPLSLRRVGGEARVVAEWPRSGPGRYRLRLSLDGVVRDAIVHVRPAKISSDELSDLVEELQTSLPVNVALALKRAGGHVGLTLSAPRAPSLAEELERLRIAIRGDGVAPGLDSLLRQIARDPHHILRSHELWVPRERARRPVPGRLAQALLRAGNLAPDDTPLAVVDGRVEQSADVYENRLAQTFTRLVERRLRRVRAALVLRGDTHLLTETDALLASLRSSRREASFLEGVSELSRAPDRATMVLLRRPEYRALLESFLRFRRGLAVRLEDPALDSPLEELPHLYQLWGTMHVLLALLDVGVRLGYHVVTQRLIGQDAAGYFFRPLPDGSAAVELVQPVDGTTVRLVPERVYRPRQVASAGALASVSFTQRPDIAVEVHRPGEPARVYLFDPKYKLEGDGTLGGASRPLKQDIDKMHAYRDAIRDATGRRVVHYAAILYPGQTRTFGGGVAALGATPTSGGELARRLERVFTRALSRGETTPRRLLGAEGVANDEQ